jgi:hypothetical protein
MNNTDILIMMGASLIGAWIISIIVFFVMLAYHMLDDMDD